MKGIVRSTLRDVYFFVKSLRDGILQDTRRAEVLTVVYTVFLMRVVFKIYRWYELRKGAVTQCVT